LNKFDKVTKRKGRGGGKKGRIIISTMSVKKKMCSFSVTNISFFWFRVGKKRKGKKKAKLISLYPYLNGGDRENRNTFAYLKGNPTIA